MVLDQYIKFSRNYTKFEILIIFFFFFLQYLDRDRLTLSAHRCCGRKMFSFEENVPLVFASCEPLKHPGVELKGKEPGCTRRISFLIWALKKERKKETGGIYLYDWHLICFSRASELEKIQQRSQPSLSGGAKWRTFPIFPSFPPCP